MAGKTKLVTTLKQGGKLKKKFAKKLTKKVRRTHKGYGMKSIVKGQMTYKRKSRKR